MDKKLSDLSPEDKLLRAGQTFIWKREKEYIERKALLDEICRDNCERVYDGACHNCRMTEMLADFPASDVAEVRHGEWKYDPNGMDWGLGAWVCSVCGCKNNNLGTSERINPYLFSGSKFCPNCGTKMDGGNENAVD